MALKFENVMSPAALSQIYQMLNQMRATGRVVTPRDVQAAYRAVLQTETENAMRARQLAQQRSQWLQQFHLQRDAMKDKQDANTMAGLGMLGSLAWQGLRPNSVTGQSPLGNLLGMFKKPVSGIQSAISNVFSPTEEFVPAVSAGTLSGFTPDFSNIAAPAASAVTDNIDNAVNSATSSMEPISSFLGNATEGITGTLGNAADWIGETAGNLFSGIGGLFD